MKTRISLARLRQVLSYDHDTGLFTWLVRHGGGTPGSSARIPDWQGYVYVSIDGRKYLAHRLAWFYVTGEWPVGVIDHINRDPGDNRFSNLREATISQNNVNSRMRPANKSGFRGVCLRSDGKGWAARIGVQGRKINLGSFATPEEAAAAYMAAVAEHYPAFIGDTTGSAS